MHNQIVGALAACTALYAAAALADDQPDPRIGDKASSICFAQSINGWKTVKGYNKAVLLEKGVNDWYLVEVGGACRARDFKFTETIGIESRPAGGCVTRGDALLVRAPGNYTKRCYISAIYEWNDDALAPEEEESSDDDQEDVESEN